MRYPFVVKNKSVIVIAPTYANALDRVLYKHRNKFVKTKYAKNVAKHQKLMDLINVQKDAKAQSKAKKNQLIYVILEDDEFIIKDFMAVKEKDDVYSIWRNGAKYDEPEKEESTPVKTPLVQMKVTKRTPIPSSPLAAEKNESQKTVNKTESKMETVKKVAKKSPKKVAKKVAKKAPAKKLTPKTAKKFAPGKVVKISIADMIKNMKKGFYYRDPQGVRQTEAYMKTRANQEYVREGMHEYKEA